MRRSSLRVADRNGPRSDLDLAFEVQWKSLGAGVHYQFHYLLGTIGTFHPPDARTSSLIAPNGNVRNDDYPSPAWVDAIDKAHGRSDDQLAEFTRLAPALKWLRCYDPVGADVVLALCVKGRSSTAWRRGVRHYSIDQVATWRTFDDDVRRASEYLHRSWEFLGCLLATPRVLRKAVEAGAVEPWAIQFCREHGLVELPDELQ